MRRARTSSERAASRAPRSAILAVAVTAGDDSVFETQRLLSELYRRQATTSELHLLLARVHGLLDVLLGRLLPAGDLRAFLQRAIGVPWVTFTTCLADGITLRHHLEDYHVLGEVLRDDVYRLRELPPRSTVVDVGAQVGAVTVLCARRFAAARVIAFEPSRHNFALASANVASNRCTGVVLHPTAVAARSGDTVLFLNRTATHSLRQPTRRRETVQAVSLDGALRDEPVIDLLKIDVEGAELGVLDGARVTMERTRRIAIETHAELMSGPEDVAAVLAAAGFTVERTGVIVHGKRG
jgi:FkbM family methyltransferase